MAHGSVLNIPFYAGVCLSSVRIRFQLQPWIKSGSPQGLKVGRRLRSARLKKLRSDLVSGSFLSTSGFNTDLSGNRLVRTGLFQPGRRIVITSRRLLWQDLRDRSTWQWCMLLFSPSLPLSRFLSWEKVSWWCAAQTRLNLHFPLREALNYGADESSRSKNGTLKGKTPSAVSEWHGRGRAEHTNTSVALQRRPTSDFNWMRDNGAVLRNGIWFSWWTIRQRTSR